MGVVKAIKAVIQKFRNAGKTEKEISDIIEVAAEKASVNGDAIRQEYRKPEIVVAASTEDLKKALECAGITMQQAAEAINRFGRNGNSQKRQETNNWRKMHGLPMRRKQERRKRSGKRKRADRHRKNTRLS